MVQKDFLIISHKGAGNYAPANTLKAIQKAIDLKADFVEFDIHKTKDDKIILIHDANIINNSGNYVIIKEMTINQIKMFDIGEGEKIPSLEEVISISKNKINLQIEIKAEGLIDDLVKLLNREGLINTSIISSFSLNELIKLKKIAPKLKVGYLLPAEMKRIQLIKRNIIKAFNHHFYAIHPHFSIITKEVIDYSKNHNLAVYAWTVNDALIMKNLIKLGVDGIITDEILLLKKCLNESSL
jgi:glycerophosphoryl diester phosphodiesterase